MSQSQLYEFGPYRLDIALWRLERAGEFPERKPLSANRVAWKESEVAAWIAQRKGRRGGGAVTT